MAESGMNVTKFETKSHDTPDEVRAPNKTRVEVVRLPGFTLGRLNFEPGWKWSESVKPIAKTPSCQVHHIGYVLSGQMRVRMENGEEQEYGPGDTYIIPPGHDAWIVGNDVYVGVDVSGEMMDYAKR